MMEISKNKSQFGASDITICSGDKKFQLFFGGDLDLYWSCIDLSQDTNDVVRFNITKENYFLYSLVEELYERIKNCRVFDVEECELEFCETSEEVDELYKRKQDSNERLKGFSNYEKLFDSSTGIISWHDDESIYEEGNVVNIIPGDEEFILEFVPGVKCDAYDMIGIRFRNSGSTYTPFNSVFMRMFNQLQDYDPNYHQIHIEEVLYNQKVKKIGTR